MVMIRFESIAPGTLEKVANKPIKQGGGSVAAASTWNDRCRCNLLAYVCGTGYSRSPITDHDSAHLLWEQR
jgi:hypothetical protein